MDYSLIEISDYDSDSMNNSQDASHNSIDDEHVSNIETLKDDEIMLIKKESIGIDDPIIMDFINHCIKNNLFDDTFYDYGNEFSIIATKLPVIFNTLSNDKNIITETAFVRFFMKVSKFSNKKNTKYIFNKIDYKKSGKIDWDTFMEFFIPFVKNITI